ncbi:MAG: hypothetical protein KF906_03030 [Actinobacteria bacterium]|nr:hypothetical protein [Actinomycetota bacterium]
MTSSTPTPAPPPRRRGLDGRTRLVTVVSIVAVVLAGAAAVSANVGILDSASDGSVGSASASGDLADPSSRVLDVYLPDEVTDDDGDPFEQTYVVDVAGKVTVVSSVDGLRLGEVDPEDGWTWTLDQPDPTHIAVVMTNGARTFELDATQNLDRTITAKVTEPIDGAVSAPSTAATSPPATAAPAPITTSGSSVTVDDHGDGSDDSVERAEDESEQRESEAEDREKEQEDRSEHEEGHDDDD